MKTLLTVVALFFATAASAAGPQPCYFSGQFVKCFPPSGLNVPAITWTDTTKGVVGTTTNDSAAAGYVGQYLENKTATSSVAASATTFDAASLVLTAGDWDVNGAIAYIRNSATFTSTDMFIGVTAASGTSFGNAVSPITYMDQVAFIPTSFTIANMLIGPLRVQSDGTNLYINGVTFSSIQTVYLKGFCGSFTGTAQYSAFFRARRVR